jgi:exopolyphosphatase/guanosine-5'-triphosphate,3'-diphosphate pyrophosphatase
VEAIRAMVAEAHELGAEAIAAVATAGVRMASNGPEFVQAVQAAAGVDLEVISSDDEARLAYVAATSALPAAGGLLAVFDTGGGSSQFTFGTLERPGESFSVNVGAARLTEQLGLDGVVDDATLAAARIAIAAELSALDGRPPPDAVIGLGGANTNLAAVSHGLAVYDPAVVHGTVLTREEVERQIELYRTLPADERRTIVGLQPDRAPVILAGALIVRTVLGQLGALSLTVSDRGLRHGVLAERFGG